MRIECPPLPFADDALEPHMSAETLRLHHGKHQKAYFDKLQALVAGTDFADLDLETIIVSTAKARGAKPKAIFDNAAQLWNHSFFWRSLAPAGGGLPAALAQRLERDFGGFARFRERFAAAAAGLFGSGWVWLAERKGKLEILALSNAGTPIADGASLPLLTLDAWEHAYFLDYGTKKPDYLAGVLKHINWATVEKRHAMTRMGKAQ